MDALFAALEATGFALLVEENRSLFPLLETLHYVGLALLLGILLLLDLRLLGMARKLPFAPLSRLTPWAVAGFIINLITGVMLFMTDPDGYYFSIGFRVKMGLIALAGLNLALFRTRVLKEADKLGPDDNASVLAKTVAATSLVLWLSIIAFGRLIPDLGSLR